MAIHSVLWLLAALGLVTGCSSSSKRPQEVKQMEIQPTNTVRLSSTVATPAEIVIEATGTSWILDAQTGAIVRWKPGEQPSRIELSLNGKPLSATDVSTSGDGRLWFVAEAGGSDVCAFLKIDSPSLEVEAVSIAKPARHIVSLADGEIWFIANDTTLNSQKGPLVGPIADGRYNAMITSSKGDRVAIRTIGDDNVFTATLPIKNWTRAASGFGGKMIGFAPDGALLLLEYDLNTMVDDVPKAKLRVYRDGKSTVFLSGALLDASIHGSMLVVIRSIGTDTQLETYTYQ